MKENDFNRTKIVDISSIYPYTMTQHNNSYPYKEIVESLFDKRLETKDANPLNNLFYGLLEVLEIENNIFGKL